MKSCTFFGHRECPEDIRESLKQVLVELIEAQGVEMFYVGHQGRFDAMVRSVLRELAGEYAHIRYAVVLAYLPTEKDPPADDTMLPEGIELVHPKFALSWRNDWMLKQADVVVVYITHFWGGAAQWVVKAQKQGKPVINLSKTAPL